MPGPETVRAVSETLQALLQNRVGPLANVIVNDLVEPPPTGSETLTIFLYDIIEDPNTRNRPPVRTPAQSSTGQQQVRISMPPAALVLRYMITPWGGDTLTEHEIMGRVVQAFYDHPTLAGPLLQGALAGTDEALRVALQPIELDSRARVWEAIEKPYRLSLNYEVRVVKIDSAVAYDTPAVVEQVVQPAIVQRP